MEDASTRINLRDENDPPLLKRKVRDSKLESLRLEYKKYFGYKPVAMSAADMAKRIGKKAADITVKQPVVASP
jgi:hypothetical protein